MNKKHNDFLMYTAIHAGNYTGLYFNLLVLAPVEEIGYLDFYKK